MEDKISELPEEIIHRILSHFTSKAAARASLFCKAWYRAWLTCPPLQFGGGGGGDFVCPTNRYFKVLENTLRRYQRQKTPIEQLILGLPEVVMDSTSVSVVNECIGIAIQSGVKKLKLLLLYVPKGSAYILPHTVFGAKTIRELSVSGKVKLKKGAGEEMMLKYLQKLQLWGIRMDDDLLQEIITRCPLIEDLHIERCKGLKRIKVIRVCKLKKIRVSPHHSTEAIEIDAPNLEYLDCVMWRSSLDLYTTTKLKYLSLVGHVPSTTFFDNFMHKFPQLEDVRLDFSHGLERINISSHSLKRIKLGTCSEKDLKEVKIDVPSMVSLSLTLRSGFLSNISFGTGNYNFEFFKVREYLSKFVQSKISLVLEINVECSFNYVGHDSIGPIQVEDIDLRVDYPTERLMLNPNFLDALLLTCHPKTITVDRFNEATKMFLHRNLIERSINHHCHDENKSWYKHLKNVRFEILDSRKFCFTLEWKV